MLLSALFSVNWNKSRAAHKLCWSRMTLYRKIAKYNLLAVPVVDDDDRMQGIVTIDDALDTVMPAGIKRRARTL